MTRELTLNAHHEAAHVVIYEHFGISVEDIGLYRCGAGYCHVSSVLSPTYGQLLAILAGPEADKVFLANDTEALSKRRDGWRKDNEDAGSVLRQLDGGYSMEDAVAEAGQLVETNRRLIHLLAEKWVEDSKQSWAAADPLYIMGGDEVRGLIRRFFAS